MRLPEIGQRIRQARIAKGLTQAELAVLAGVSRVTINHLESGSLKDLGIAKVLAVARQVGLRLEVTPDSARNRGDYLAMATRAANVGFRTTMDEDQLLSALLSGKAPIAVQPNIRRLLEDSPRPLLNGLYNQVSGWTRPGRLARQMEKLARTIGIADERIGAWTKND